MRNQTFYELEITFKLALFIHYKYCKYLIDTLARANKIFSKLQWYCIAGNYVSIIFCKLPANTPGKNLAITKCSHFWSIMSKLVYHIPLHRQMSSVP